MFYSSVSLWYTWNVYMDHCFRPPQGIGWNEYLVGRCRRRGTTAVHDPFLPNSLLLSFPCRFWSLVGGVCSRVLRCISISDGVAACCLQLMNSDYRSRWWGPTPPPTHHCNIPLRTMYHKTILPHAIQRGLPTTAMRRYHLLAAFLNTTFCAC